MTRCTTCRRATNRTAQNRSFTLACIAGLAAAANAGVDPTGPFTGDAFEDFEGVATPGGHPAPLPIFGGSVLIDDTLAHTIVITFFWSAAGGGSLTPYAGNLMGGPAAGPAVFTFSTPVRRFGGYMTTIGSLPDGTITFRDPLGAQIASLPMTLTPFTWRWQGWTSDQDIGSIEIVSNNGPGWAVQFDDLQKSAAEAPGCQPDLTTGAVPGQPGYGVANGVLNNDDFFYYLSQFAAGNVAIADLTTGAVPGQPGYGVPNGVINNDDFFYYLSVFAAGC